MIPIINEIKRKDKDWKLLESWILNFFSEPVFLVLGFIVSMPLRGKDPRLTMTKTSTSQGKEAKKRFQGKI